MCVCGDGWEGEGLHERGKFDKDAGKNSMVADRVTEDDYWVVMEGQLL